MLERIQISYKKRTRTARCKFLSSILLSNSSHSRDGSKVTFNIHHHLPPLSPPMRHALGSVASKSRPSTRICDAPNPTLVLYYSYCPSLSFFTAHHHLHSPPFPPSMSRAWSLHSDFPSMSTGDSSNHSLIYSPGFAPIRLDTPVVGSLAGVCLVRRA